MSDADPAAPIATIPDAPEPADIDGGYTPRPIVENDLGGMSLEDAI
jgi:hypothetical protein